MRSDPAKGSHLRVFPLLLSLTFSEPPNVPLSHVSLVGPGGTAVTLATLAIDPKDHATIIARIAAKLVAGHYTVRWQMAGNDGHPVRGEYGFDIDSGAVAPAPSGGELTSAPGAPASTVASPAAAEEPMRMDVPAVHDAATFDASSPLYVAIRAMQFAAAALLLGAVAFRCVVVPRFARSAPEFPTIVTPMVARSAAVAGWAAWSLLGVTLARLVAQHAAFFGVGTTWNTDSLGAIVWGSAWAVGWWLAVAGSVVAIVASRLARQARASGWATLALASLVIAASLTLSGHAAAATNLVLALSVDGMHVIGAGGWIGSLSMVVVAGLPAAAALPDEQGHVAVGALLSAFSPTALVFAGVLALTGAIAGWRNLGSVGALFTSTYGQVLVAKLSALSVAVGTGAYNWKRVLPALGTVHGTTRLRLSASIEIASALVVLIVTAVLVATPMPAEMMASPAR